MREAHIQSVQNLADAAYGFDVESEEAFRAKCRIGNAVVVMGGIGVIGYGVALPWSGELPALQSKPELSPDVPDYLYVHDICVDVDYRRKGIGRKFMNMFQGVAISRGMHEMRAVAVQGSADIWLKLGWETTDEAVPFDFPKPNIAIRKRF